MAWKFLLISGIAVIAWGALIGAFRLFSGHDIPDWVGVSLYVLASYLAPLAFLVGIIGSIVYAVKAIMRR